MNQGDLRVFRDVQDSIESILQQSSHATLPDPLSLSQAATSLHKALPEEGKGLRTTSDHILREVVPGLNGSSLSSTYYGFVTGGITSAARLADNLVTLFDQNVCVHLPKDSVATLVEDRALCMLLELLDFEPRQWPARSFTTGATASNILGLACGRDYVITESSTRMGLDPQQGEGILSTCFKAGIEAFQVLTTLPHSSLGKAASVVGLGSATLIDVTKVGHFLDFDMVKLEKCLAAPKTASIVVISCGAVNTGTFATNSTEEVQAIRHLCDRYSAWLHVDGAFGLFALALPGTPHYARIRAGTSGLDLADSIGGDGHKLLNVPYDTGFFFCRHRDIPSRVFQNQNAAYLSTTPTDNVLSPLNNRLENSARFRGLPVYATLAAYGRDGYAAMLGRMVDLARRVVGFVREECGGLELLPKGLSGVEVESTFICVLFRAKDEALNEVLAGKIRTSRRLHVSGTAWDGKPATRLAIAKWDVDVERDFAVVKEVLRGIL